KQVVSSQSQELEALEAKLRETEARLKEKQSSPSGKGASATGSGRQPALASPNARSQGSSAPVNSPSSKDSPSASTMSYWKPQMPGTMPDTPGDSRKEGYMSSGRDGS
ncbi:MAG: hypothetical protein Q9174_002123, partial [Haloplaca sp. 1 TL-2023]